MEPLSFNDFVKKCKEGTPAQDSTAEIDIGLSNEQIQKQVDKAARMLKGFVPPKKGGVS